ncbi:MAG TPA: signal recognition particle-docking protein FtsY [Victivallales bacterium]|nr:signal recognition particle-docking protein FtsY [Victivallales bacterium]
MSSVLNKFHKGLRKTAVSFSRKVKGCFIENAEWTDETFEELEAALIGSDFGVQLTLRIIDNIREKYRQGIIKTGSDIVDVAKSEVLTVLEKNNKKLNVDKNGLTVILMVGVNGSGKTTTSGKLAGMLKKNNKKVMLAACDTFRAAAVDQLKLWGAKTDTYVVSAKHGADSASVAFDAVEAALSRKYDFLIIDTAGRQHNRKGLMDELSKVIRTISKVYPEAPQEIVLVVDSSTGANAIAQAREFSKVCGVNGLICTKLDGTFKGGMVVGIKEEMNLPMLYVGLGEGEGDLQVFDPEMFTNSLFEDFK